MLEYLGCKKIVHGLRSLRWFEKKKFLRKSDKNFHIALVSKFQKMVIMTV